MSFETFDEYGEQAFKTAIYPNRGRSLEDGEIKADPLAIALLKIAARATRITEKNAKVLRDSDKEFNRRDLMGDLRFLGGLVKNLLRELQADEAGKNEKPLTLEDADGIVYVAMKTLGESGEIAELIAGHCEAGTPFADIREKLDKETGDILWYVNALSGETGTGLRDVARMNTEKLASRRQRGKIEGDGSDR